MCFIFQEVKPNLLEMLHNIHQPMEKLLEELMDGDILVFQKDEEDFDQYELPTAKEYFRQVIVQTILDPLTIHQFSHIHFSHFI